MQSNCCKYKSNESASQIYLPGRKPRTVAKSKDAFETEDSLMKSPFLEQEAIIVKWNKAVDNWDKTLASCHYIFRKRTKSISISKVAIGLNSGDGRDEGEIHSQPSHFSGSIFLTMPLHPLAIK